MGYTVMTVMIRSIPGPEQVWLVWKISTIDFMCPGELRRFDVQRLSLSHTNGCQTTLFATILTSLSSSLSLSSCEISRFPFQICLVDVPFILLNIFWSASFAENIIISHWIVHHHPKSSSSENEKSGPATSWDRLLPWALGRPSHVGRMLWSFVKPRRPRHKPLPHFSANQIQLYPSNMQLPYSNQKLRRREKVSVRR